MSETDHFKASKGWLRRFAARHKFTFAAIKIFKKKPKKRNSITSETRTDFSVSTIETFLNSVDLPQLGDEFFNFEESAHLVHNVPKTIPVPAKNWSFDSFHQVLPKEDFDVYSFLKLDEEGLESDYFQNPSQTIAWQQARAENGKYSHVLGYPEQLMDLREPFQRDLSFRQDMNGPLYYNDLLQRKF